MKIGNTPIEKIIYKYNGKIGEIYVKLEYYNFTGSIKDRIVYRIIKNNLENGSLKEGMTLVEATSGNTGISIAAIGAYFGFKTHIFMPNWVSKERESLMKMYGAEVTLFSKEEGGFKRAIEESKKFAKENYGFLINQFENIENVNAHYETTGKEILCQVENIKGFVSGIGTGGTLIGVSKRLKENDKNVKVAAIEPDKMPLLSKRIIIENHKIEGIGDDFIPKIVDRNLIDDVIEINDDDAINMSKKLAKELGIGCRNIFRCKFYRSGFTKRKAVK